ncbi:unnamed protein product [Spirodela intermedia]|uniref:ABC transporter domain-containing protein n=1 Tax=Spirodela intermedia TaxID=51605 RepID=A0A7I8JCC5_SPIIN|nr:unnamed protein product [Spirodela intermedia]CAA6667042.1 unnamed protein product [Spirodela intermedia]
MPMVELQAHSNTMRVADGGGAEDAASVFRRCQVPVILKMLAMLGPSGSGKTTLLTALGGRLGGGALSGSITYNGRPFSSAMRRNLGFVTQDDVLYPHLTVAETLLYTALLRLPRSLSRSQKAAAADAVVVQLGLAACRSSIIGGPLLRGISGGERKRVSIGQEMLVNPSLILLDEPTSGLDSTTAQRIVTTLGSSPATAAARRLFYMFHKVLLLSQGSLVYFGKGSAAMAYFSSVGYQPSVAMNPADFLLDLANGIVSEDQEATKEALVAAFAASSARRDLDEELREVGGQFKELGEAGRRSEQWATTWWEQFTVLLQRGMKERRHEALSGLRMAQVAASALLAGLLWWRSGDRLQDQIGLVFFMTGFCGFFPLFEAIFTFPQERTVLAKERSSGMYRLSSYFAARTAGDLPMELALPAALIAAVYWMAGMEPSGGAFFQTMGVMLLGVLVSQGLGLALGALVMNLKTATTLASVLMLAFMLAGGFFVQKVPLFMAWIKYLSIMYHLFRLTLIGGAACYVEDYPAVKAVGLDRSDVSIAALFAMFFFYRLAAYLGLMRVGVAR